MLPLGRYRVKDNTPTQSENPAPTVNSFGDVTNGERIAQFFFENWLALVSTVPGLLALVGWWDNRRRLNRDEVGFTITPKSPDEWLIRNTGKRTIWSLRIDLDSVKGFETPIDLLAAKLTAGEASWFTLHPNQFGKLPDGIKVAYKLHNPFFRFQRTHIRYVVFPDPPA